MKIKFQVFSNYGYKQLGIMKMPFWVKNLLRKGNKLTLVSLQLQKSHHSFMSMHLFEI